jgi:hypothetical protein
MTLSVEGSNYGSLSFGYVYQPTIFVAAHGSTSQMLTLIAEPDPNH